MEQNTIPSDEHKINQDLSSAPVKPTISEEMTKRSSDPSPTKDEQHYQKEDRNSKRKVWWKHNGINFVLAVGTIGTLIAYIFVSVYQYDLTREAIQKSDEANAIAKGAIDYTQRINADAEKVRRTELMAYVYIKDITINYGGEGKAGGWFVVENTGRTPAKNTRIVYDVKANGKVVSNDDFENIKKRDRLIGVSISPGIPKTVKLDMSFRVAFNRHPDGLMEQISDVYLYGLILYEDIFGGKQENKFVFKYDNGIPYSFTPQDVPEIPDDKK